MQMSVVRKSSKRYAGGGLSAIERVRKIIPLLYSVDIRFHVCVHKSISFFPPKINNIIKPPSRKLLLKIIIILITIGLLFIHKTCIIYYIIHTKCIQGDSPSMFIASFFIYNVAMVFFWNFKIYF